MANKFLALDQFGDEVELLGLETSGGVADAHKVVATGPDGRVDLSIMPSGFGSDIEPIISSEAISAGDWINVYDHVGTRTCRKASNLDNTKPVAGFAKASFASGAVVAVYLRGLNDQIPIGTFDDADAGKKAFLGVAGGTTVAPPTATGNYLQALGPIVNVDEVGAKITVNFSYNPGITRA